MKFKIVIATTNMDSQGDQFSPEALQQMADTAVGKPVTWNFETELPAKITAAYLENGQLVVEGESSLDLFLVPGFTRELDGGRKLEITKVGLTHRPADLGLPSIKIEPGAVPDWFPPKADEE